MKRLSVRLSASHDSATPLLEDSGGSEHVKAKASFSDNELLISSPAGGTGLLPESLRGPWLLDYEDLKFDDLMDESPFTEVYRGKYREHEVAIKKLVLRAWGEETLGEVARQVTHKNTQNQRKFNKKRLN
jgi:hypothetical protein